MKITGEWTEPEKKTLMSELLQTQKDKYGMYMFDSMIIKLESIKP